MAYAFDFGAGSTCAVEYSGYTQNPKTGKEIPNWRSCCICRTGGGTYEIPTYFGKTMDGRYIIGGDVSTAARLQWKKRAWKTRPTAASKEQKKYTQQFMHEVFSHFAQENANAIADNNSFIFTIGYPCDWSDKDAEEYKQMAQNALRGINNFDDKDVQIIAVRESQAATLYARKKLDVPLDAFETGVLLIDLGSSTTDFTFVKGLAGLHCGIDLGANRIDAIIAQHALDHDGDAQDWFKQQFTQLIEENRDSIQFDILAFARQNKEAMFNSQDGESRSMGYTYYNPQARDLHFGVERFLNVEYFADKIFDKGQDDEEHEYKFRLELHGNDFWQELENVEQSWRAHFRQVLSIIKKKWSLPKDLTVIITGGASRMAFILNDIKSVYKNAAIVVSDDTDKSFSVANGLAYAAYANLTIEEARKTFDKKLSCIAERICDDVFNAFCDGVYTATCEAIEDYLIQGEQEFRTWKSNGRVGKKPKDSANSVKRELNDVLQSKSRTIGEKYNRNNALLIGKIKENKEIRDSLNALCEEFGVPNLEFCVKALSIGTDINFNFETQVDFAEKVFWRWTYGDELWADARHGNWVIFPKSYWEIAIKDLADLFTIQNVKDELKRSILKSSLRKQIEEAIVSYFEQYTDAIAGIALIENQK